MLDTHSMDCGSGGGALVATRQRRRTRQSNPQFRVGTRNPDARDGDGGSRGGSCGGRRFVLELLPLVNAYLV